MWPSTVSEEHLSSWLFLLSHCRDVQTIGTMFMLLFCNSLVELLTFQKILPCLIVYRENSFTRSTNNSDFRSFWWSAPNDSVGWCHLLWWQWLGAGYSATGKRVMMVYYLHTKRSVELADFNSKLMSILCGIMKGYRYSMILYILLDSE